MVAQVNSQAEKVLEVADDPRLSREVKEFLKVLISATSKTFSACEFT